MSRFTKRSESPDLVIFPEDSEVEVGDVPTEADVGMVWEGDLVDVGDVCDRELAGLPKNSLAAPMIEADIAIWVSFLEYPELVEVLENSSARGLDH